MKYDISGIYTARNTIEANYPFVESILSVLPGVDEFLINDGGSNDGTLEVLYKLEDTYDKISVYEIEDTEETYWKCIDIQLEKLISKCSGDWIFESQADELWDPADIKQILRVLSHANKKGCNSIRQPRLEVDREGNVISEPYNTVRIVRNIDKLSSSEGGDNFYIDNAQPKEGYTAHSVTPEFYSTVPFYHANNWYDSAEQSKRHAKWLAPNHEVRQRAYESRKGTYKNMTNRRLYEVDDRMFDPEWVSNITGFDYTNM